MHRITLPLLVAASLLTGACTRTVEPTPGPLTFAVTFPDATAADLGQDGDPLPYTFDPTAFTIDIEAIDIDGSRMTDFEGRVSLRSRPGKLIEPKTVELREGLATGVTVQIERAFGPVRLWAVDTEREDAAFAAGSSPEIRFEDPTAAQVQTPLNENVSALIDNHVEVRAADRELVVTHVASDGFYVSDVTDGGVEPYGHLFAFSFSRPRDVEVGDRLSALDGNVDEYLSYTELGYPSWLVDTAGHDLPDPITLTADEICAGTELLEKYESGLVKITNVQTSFAGADDCADYLEYDQWPVQLLDAGSCAAPEIQVVSSYTVPGLRFLECEEGQTPPVMHFDWIVGMLRNNEYADPQWMLMVRGCEDLPEANRPDHCAEDEAAARSHYSGPHPVPREFHREYDGWLPYEIE